MSAIDRMPEIRALINNLVIYGYLTCCLEPITRVRQVEVVQILLDRNGVRTREQDRCGLTISEAIFLQRMEEWFQIPSEAEMEALANDHNSNSDPAANKGGAERAE